MPIQLTPEIEAALQAEAAARGVSLETILRDAFDQYKTALNNNQLQTVPAPADERRPEIAWTIRPDLRYRGEWVALEGSEVVAHGKDGRAVSAFARAKSIRSPFLFFVADPDQTPFVGGWLESARE